MKKIIAALIVILGLSFGGLWYYGAGQAKDFITEKVNEAEAFAKANGYSLKHEGISVTGFPFAYNAEIKSPTLTKNSDNQDPAQNLQEARLDGSFILSSNLIGTSFSIKKQGEGHVTTNYAQKQDKLLLSGNSEVTFSVDEKSYLEAIKNPFKTLFKLIENNENDFVLGKKGSVHLENIKLINEENPSLVLFELEKGDVQYQIKEDDGAVSFARISGNIKGLDLDTFMVGSDAFRPGRERSLKEIALLLSMPKPGKTDMSFDLEVTAPMDEFQDLGDNPAFADIPSFKIHLKNLDLTNNFGNYTHRGILSLQDIKEDARQVHFDFLATSETSKSQFESFRTKWSEFLNNLPVCEEHSGSKGEACLLYKSIIPKLDEFGKITFQIDLDLLWNNLQDPSDNSKLTVRHLDYFAAIYGLKSDGLIDFKKPELVDGTYKIRLSNYETLFQDLYNYLKKVQRILPYINPETAKIPQLSEKHLKMVTNYLREISDEPKKDLKDIEITITIKGPNDIKIGTISLGEFVKKSNVFISGLAEEFQSLPAPQKQDTTLIPGVK